MNSSKSNGKDKDEKNSFQNIEHEEKNDGKTSTETISETQENQTKEIQQKHKKLKEEGISEQKKAAKPSEEEEEKEEDEEEEKEEEEEKKSREELLSELKEKNIEVDKLRDKVKKLEEESTKWKEKFMHLQADYENAQKRWERSRGEQKKQHIAAVLKDFLPLYDSFEKAQENITEENEEEYEHVMQFFKQYLNILKSYGAKPMKVQKNDKFDYNFHEALTTIENPDLPRNTIVDVIQDGWIWKDKVLRYAKVVISTKPKPKPKPPEEKEEEEGKDKEEGEEKEDKEEGKEEKKQKTDNKTADETHEENVKLEENRESKD
ncbi:MAG: nucleotide exchange factor GrpE [Promethearchaeia archaeon]